MRAIIIRVQGNVEPMRCCVVFDRYGLNSGLFKPGMTDEQLITQATSNALASVIQKYGTSYIKDYSVTTVD